MVWMCVLVTHWPAKISKQNQLLHKKTYNYSIYFTPSSVIQIYGTTIWVQMVFGLFPQNWRVYNSFPTSLTVWMFVVAPHWPIKVSKNKLLHKYNYHRSTYSTLPSIIQIHGTTRRIQTWFGQPITEIFLLKMEEENEYSQVSKKASSVSIDSNNGEVSTKKDQE